MDNRLVLFSTATIQAFTIASGMATVVNNGVTVGGKTAPTVTDATGTNWLLVPDLDQLGQAIPDDGLALGIFVGGGTCTGTGSLTITGTIAFSDDASTVKSSRLMAPLTITGTSAVLAPNYGQIHLGDVFNHKYIKVSWAIALTTLTGPTLTPFTVGFDIEPDSGIGRVGNNLS